MRESIEHYINSYRLLYPEESFPILEEQLRGDEDITTRQNFLGHVVADGCVIDAKQKKILMIYHALHKQWFCPGGHIEKDDIHPAVSARREVQEETGVLASSILDNEGQPLLLHIDSHVIPLNTKKNEPEHWHHAMTFLFLADSTVPLPDNKDDGIASCQWVDIQEALRYERIRVMLSKIELM